MTHLILLKLRAEEEKVNHDTDSGLNMGVGCSRIQEARPSMLGVVA